LNLIELSSLTLHFSEPRLEVTSPPAHDRHVGFHHFLSSLAVRKLTHNSEELMLDRILLYTRATNEIFQDFE